ncbi:R2-like ligand-binding oxidase [Meiothermus sp.]|uniref:R2-like ligand-binding oxidase n=1 Tax=Meiothermus sp. TaxID=1955249 RepID=UPI0021DE4C02|nr:R2-like ligand-binding oxidase [Meiothermus sp.]GIW24874.1 MAG: ribonucleotide-diphosphate reductase [Meiothermus sp.]
MRKFATNQPGRLEDDFVVGLYHKSKRNFWNPQDLDFSQDRQDWNRLSTDQQNVLLQLSALFVGGEEAVTLDLAPYLLHVTRNGSFDEALYVATWTFEEAKHAEFFDHFHRKVVGGTPELALLHVESWKQIFYQALPQAMNALQIDSSAVAEVRALGTYNLIVEGVLAETGYRAYKEVLEKQNLMPGLRKGLSYIQADEGRHIAFGLHKLSKLLFDYPQAKEALEDVLSELIPAAIGIVREVFAAHQPMPFDIYEEDFVDYSLRQLQHRSEVLQRPFNPN